ncbi:unnamed protein product, partial [Mesorhabditis spiculigera]
MLLWIAAVVVGAGATFTNCYDYDPNCALYLENRWCSSPLWNATMKYNYCGASCRMCTSCVDADPNCPIYASNGYCDGPATYAEKISKCAKTCGYCYDPNNGCVDADPNCPIYRGNGYCTDPQYSDAVRMQKCRKTCKYCQCG